MVNSVSYSKVYLRYSNPKACKIKFGRNALCRNVTTFSIIALKYYFKLFMNIQKLKTDFHFSKNYYSVTRFKLKSH